MIRSNYRRLSALRAVVLGAEIAILAILPVLAASPAQAADKRVALVIGNSAYQHAPGLPNPRNDASDMSDKLKGLGFQLFGGQDLDRTGMFGALTTFGRAAENADVALVFYAGHGLQVNGQNYLVPVDASVEYEAEADIALVPFNLVMQQLNRGSRINIALLDACRDNPFAKDLSRTMGTRAVGALGRGLSRTPSVSGSFIAYATQPDNVAQDGSGRNSPFTSALLKFIERPGLSLPDLMIEVRKEVINATNGKQVPWDSSSLTGRFSFKIEGTITIAPEGAQPGAQPTPLAAPADPRIADTMAWLAAQGSTNALDFETYLQNFPNGMYARQAHEKLESLRRSPVAALPPEPQKPTQPVPSAAIGATSARVFSVDTRCCGPLYYNFIPGGKEVSGDYPKQRGRISGTVDSDGTATGIWTQPRSDHPCSRERGGTLTWGRFVIRKIGTPAISGEWGYCDTQLDHNWGFENPPASTPEAVAWAASAKLLSVDTSCCGPLYYNLISAGKEVSGEYPKQRGRISGTVDSDATATGIWTQPRSDHPCSREHGGSLTWGRFVIRKIGTSAMSGEWGYCDTRLDHAWGFK